MNIGIGLPNHIMHARPGLIERMARLGEGCIAPSLPPERVADAFDTVRMAWRTAGRAALRASSRSPTTCSPTLTLPARKSAAITASWGTPPPTWWRQPSPAPRAAVRETGAAFADLGADELVFNPAIASLAEVSQLADMVL